MSSKCRFLMRSTASPLPTSPRLYASSSLVSSVTSICALILASGFEKGRLRDGGAASKIHASPVRLTRRVDTDQKHPTDPRDDQDRAYALRIAVCVSRGSAGREWRSDSVADHLDRRGDGGCALRGDGFQSHLR